MDRDQFAVLYETLRSPIVHGLRRKWKCGIAEVEDALHMVVLRLLENDKRLHTMTEKAVTRALWKHTDDQVRDNWRGEVSRHKREELWYKSS